MAEIAIPDNCDVVPSQEALEGSRSIILRAKTSNLTSDIDTLAVYIELLMLARDKRLKRQRPRNKRGNKK